MDYRSLNRPLHRLLPLMALTVMAGVWTWWALVSGAYFGVVFYPGAIVLLGALLLLLSAGAWRARLTGAPLVAAGALVLLALHTLMSILWTPAEEVAISDSHRVILYAVAFGLGLWSCHLLGRRMALALLPVALAGAVAGLVTLIGGVTADNPSPLLELGVLDKPLGYHNANAAFFLIALFAAIGLATDPDRDWRLRGTMVGTATICAGLAILSQSRGSVLAAIAALIVFIALSRSRLRAATYLGIAALPVALATPLLLDVYSTATDEDDVLGPLHVAAAALGVAAVIAALAGGAAARAEAAMQPSDRTARLARRALGATAIVALVGVVGLFVRSQGNPVDWVNQRITEFEQGSDPKLGESRFAFNAGSERYDYWRVALDDAQRDPVLGRGAGGFQYSYLVNGKSTETPHDAHSVEFEVLSELGVPGLVLFTAFIGAAVVGGLRSRRLGPAAAALCAGAFAAAAYWLVHASIEWFWTYPAVTAPVFALLGAACAPATLWPDNRPPRRGRTLLAGTAIALVLTCLPPFLSERYTDQAYRSWRSDPGGAFTALDRAQALNPFSDAPLLAEGAIARKEGDVERAIDAFQAASEKKPDEWIGHYYLGLLLGRDDPEAALHELELAQELAPRSEDVQSALDQLVRQRASAPPGI